MAAHTPLTLDFVTLDVFTSTRFLGNPLAVVFIPPALRDRIAQDTKQRIAREFNLSETVFLHAPSNETPPTTTTALEIDIFTPEEELPFAGHPTIGTAYLVQHHLGWRHITALLTKAGPIPISSPSPGQVRAAIPHAVHVHQRTLGALLSAPFSSAVVQETIAAGLSADAAIRAAELAAPVVSIVRGMTFLLVRLPSLEHLARAAPVNRMDFGRIAASATASAGNGNGDGLLDEGEWAGGFVARYYYVLLDEGEEKKKIRTRMVELGFEDPATGSAACTLASYLAGAGAARFEMTQGVEMGRASDIAVEVVVGGENAVEEVYLGGTAVVVMSGSISV
ncbi:hypothetical protein NEMBOFW57_000091 [Staphylotrichum longicolle]|uniref:Diaminopimelate epimerase-like protein n=1 Tax=Staphylotrichum longicolle TaxID=669026 RepID=A0AAD4EYS4_9PEZI|nr:hypothetical protein NEMBOFW57_000091 [Staphylotrichum longicolle]